MLLRYITNITMGVVVIYLFPMPTQVQLQTACPTFLANAPFALFFRKREASFIGGGVKSGTRNINCEEQNLSGIHSCTLSRIKSTEGAPGSWEGLGGRRWREKPIRKSISRTALFHARTRGAGKRKHSGGETKDDREMSRR